MAKASKRIEAPELVLFPNSARVVQIELVHRVPMVQDCLYIMVKGKLGSVPHLDIPERIGEVTQPWVTFQWISDPSEERNIPLIKKLEQKCLTVAQRQMVSKIFDIPYRYKYVVETNTSLVSHVLSISRGRCAWVDSTSTSQLIFPTPGLLFTMRSFKRLGMICKTIS
ncbi:uncharacterized protein BT62DRAFT_1009917 [Guyanagaster necrorhizus]|uniref:Uncharacterized protein n=1 Tax=Guyanagaster necrorhizus TaxID=856835 RepID=A0A9P7VLU3_9AGAR|nr:uncharacterized protein BT62DRAFT_1009917 [Guyanagaster necrorhizus MCA 3950]KAG7442913.1 hypothetical protein BT62DRAFT_1009917 [Guyanagaster necrorhizus MCA 3950]